MWRCWEAFMRSDWERRRSYPRQNRWDAHPESACLFKLSRAQPEFYFYASLKSFMFLTYANGGNVVLSLFFYSFAFSFCLSFNNANFPPGFYRDVEIIIIVIVVLAGGGDCACTKTHHHWKLYVEHASLGDCQTEPLPLQVGY